MFRYFFALVAIVFAVTYFNHTPTALKSEPQRASQKVSKIKLEMQKEAPLHTPTQQSEPKSNPHRNPWPYNLEGTDLDPKDLLPFFSNSKWPAQIVYFKEGQSSEFFAKHLDTMAESRTLFISDRKTVAQIARHRFNDSTHAAKQSETREKLVPIKSYSHITFLAGKRDDNSTIAVSRDIADAIAGPDYSLVPIDRRFEPERFAHNKAKILSFGHSGEIILTIGESAQLIDQPGADFVIYENPFYFGKGLIYQEFAYVGVSQTLTLGDVTWFPCEPDRRYIHGCAGVVPTDMGGDRFDLATVAIQKAQYIWIKDFGHNHNLPGSINTEGFDLDAMEVLHGYVMQK